MKITGCIIGSIGLVLAFGAGGGRASLAGLALAAAGGLLIFISWHAGATANEKSNAGGFASAVFFAMLGIASLFAVLIGLLTGKYALAACGAAAGAFSLYSIAGADKAQVDQFTVDMGAELGFTQIREDSDYDAQGTVEGVLSAFHVFECTMRQGRLMPRKKVFCLMAACSTPNTRGLRFYAWQGGALAADIKSVTAPKAVPPPLWEDCDLRCGPAGGDLSFLTGLREAKRSVFLPENGFRSLALEDGLLKAYFTRDGKADKDQVLELLTGLARAARGI